MPSASYLRWRSHRSGSLEGLRVLHDALGPADPGRRELLQALTLRLSAQFQGFCRDLHTESVEHLLATLAPPPALFPIVQDEFLRNRKLDSGNANVDNLVADFGRVVPDFKIALRGFDPRVSPAMATLNELNLWRNAIAHEHFDPVRLGGRVDIQPEDVRRWRLACRRLARLIDGLLRQKLLSLTGRPPW